jgi:uncharacterized delta-60 repeat protein
MATVVQPDGKIVTAVRGWIGVAQYGVVRYNADGSPDLTFGNGGKAQTFFDNSTAAEPHEILLQADGKIVVVGNLNDLRQIAIVRYNADGTPDTTFDGDGKLITLISGEQLESISAAISPEGKLLVGGDIYNFMQGARAIIFRYNNDGSLDTSFDGDGALSPLSVGSAVFSIVVQPDGKIVAGGGVSGSTFSLLRLNPNGSVDTSYGNNGVATTSIGQFGVTQLYSMALMPDGRIAAGGYTANASAGASYSFAVARFNANGTLDTSLNGSGKAVTRITGNDILKEIAVQSDGKIVAAGRTNVAGGQNLVMVRYNVDGSLDTSYGTGGASVIDLGYDDNTFAMALDPATNKAIVVGGSLNFFTARITADQAPAADVIGRVTSAANGQPLIGLYVVLTDQNHNSQYALTNGFGYYIFSGVSSNQRYTVSVSSKRYTFQPEQQTVTLLESVSNVDFTGTANPARNQAAVGEKAAVKSEETPQKAGTPGKLKRP